MLEGDGSRLLLVHCDALGKGGELILPRRTALSSLRGVVAQVLSALLHLAVLLAVTRGPSHSVTGGTGIVDRRGWVVDKVGPVERGLALSGVGALGLRCGR